MLRLWGGKLSSPLTPAFSTNLECNHVAFCLTLTLTINMMKSHVTQLNKAMPWDSILRDPRQAYRPEPITGKHAAKAKVRSLVRKADDMLHPTIGRGSKVAPESRKPTPQVACAAYKHFPNIWHPRVQSMHRVGEEVARPRIGAYDAFGYRASTSSRFSCGPSNHERLKRTP